MPDLPMSFFKFIIKDKSCSRFLLISAVITIIYFILIRVLFLADSTWWDSAPYIEAASLGLEVHERPTGYSDLIRFFHAIAHSDGLLIFAQYFTNVIANLFLFFTLLYFFSLKKVYRVILFILLMCNPLYAIYSNFIMSDAFFCSLTVMWFTVLLWIMYRPRWVYFFMQLFLLYWLFRLRYNALTYPFMVAIAYLLSKQPIWKKITSITITFLLIIEIIIYTTHKTEATTGISTFSALGGWQLANNSIFVLKHENFDSTTFTSETSNEICAFIKRYYNSKKIMDSINKNEEDTDANGAFIWNHNSPLQIYERHYFTRFYIKPHYGNAGNRYIIFKRFISSWSATGPVLTPIKIEPYYHLTSFTTMGPLFKEFGMEVIKKYPIGYLRYFVWPNIKLYFHPFMEAYIDYNHYSTNKDILITYYNFNSNDFRQTHRGWITMFMYPWSWIFTLITILFLLFVGVYYLTQGYKNDAWFNKCLIFYLFFYASNFFFSIIVSSIDFRYQIFIVTLSITFIIYLLKRVFNAKAIMKKNSQKNNPNNPVI